MITLLPVSDSAGRRTGATAWQLLSERPRGNYRGSPRASGLTSCVAAPPAELPVSGFSFGARTVRGLIRIREVQPTSARPVPGRTRPLIWAWGSSRAINCSPTAVIPGEPAQDQANTAEEQPCHPKANEKYEQAPEHFEYVHDDSPPLRNFMRRSGHGTFCRA